MVTVLVLAMRWRPSGRRRAQDIFRRRDGISMDLNINGALRAVDANPDTPLLYVLRNDLGLYGPRFGCGSGLGGACFALVDGRPMGSCDLPISVIADKKITTVEGL